MEDFEILGPFESRVCEFRDGSWVLDTRVPYVQARAKDPDNRGPRILIMRSLLFWEVQLMALWIQKLSWIDTQGFQCLGPSHPCTLVPKPWTQRP